MWKKLFNLKFWLPVLLLGFGAGLTMALLKNKPTARKKANFKRGTLVDMIDAAKSSPKIEVRTHGRVRAAKKVVLSARIGGEVIWVSPNLREGRFFKKDEPLLKIGIRQSKSNLKAPFNGVVQTKNVDLGQFVNPGAQLATLLGSDQAEIVIDLPMGRMGWLPKSSNSNDQGNQYHIPVMVSLTGINSAPTHKAIIKRYLLELTPRGMMVQLIAEVDDPFQMKNNPQSQYPQKSETIQLTGNNIDKLDIPVSRQVMNIPLFLGAFVDVVIPGRQLENVVHIPAKALRDRDTVWIVSEGEIQVRNVKIAHVDFDDVYLSDGVSPGEKIIISPVKGAANGMKVQLAGRKRMDGKRKSGEKFRGDKRLENMGKRRDEKQNSPESNLSRESQ